VLSAALLRADEAPRLIQLQASELEAVDSKFDRAEADTGRESRLKDNREGQLGALYRANQYSHGALEGLPARDAGWRVCAGLDRRSHRRPVHRHLWS
jgi:hypothetical protein